MLKIPRFLKEFASYKIHEIELLKIDFPENVTMLTVKEERIYRILRNYRIGMITIDESMKAILETV